MDEMYGLQRVERRMRPYDTALICLNGHIINDHVNNRPEFNKRFCDQCGEKTIDTCPKCNHRIRGALANTYGLMSSSPAYCDECGKPFPWTESRIQAALELFADEMAGQHDDQVKEFEQSLTTISKDSPQAPVAARRIGKLVKSVGGSAGELLKKLVIEVASETLKKNIFQ